MKAIAFTESHLCFLHKGKKKEIQLLLYSYFFHLKRIQGPHFIGIITANGCLLLSHSEGAKEVKPSTKRNYFHKSESAKLMHSFLPIVFGLQLTYIVFGTFLAL